MTFLEAKTNLCNSKLNISYTDVVAGTNSLFSLQDIEDAINFGIRKTWDYKLWPFAEGTNELVASPSPGIAQFPDNAEDFEEQSWFLAIVQGVPWDGVGNGKRNFKDFMKWFADYPTDTSKIWAEYGGIFYFNGNALPADLTGIDLYGKFHSPVYITANGDDTNIMPFSLESTVTDSSGNEAIILFAYAYLLSSEKKKNPTQAAAEEKRAYGILDTIWAFIAEGKAQNVSQNRPFFNTQDNYGRGRSGKSTNIGNFP